MVSRSAASPIHASASPRFAAAPSRDLMHCHATAVAAMATPDTTAALTLPCCKPRASPSHGSVALLRLSHCAGGAPHARRMSAARPTFDQGAPDHQALALPPREKTRFFGQLLGRLASGAASGPVCMQPGPFWWVRDASHAHCTGGRRLAWGPRFWIVLLKSYLQSTSLGETGNTQTLPYWKTDICQT